MIRSGLGRSDRLRGITKGGENDGERDFMVT